MAYIFEKNKMKIPMNKDRRFKITLEDREEIRRLYSSGNYKQKKLAQIYNVSPKLISLYLDDEKLERTKQLTKKRQAEGRYYSKEKQRKCMKKTRDYKYQLYKNGELETN